MIMGCAFVILIALYILDKKHNNYVTVYEGTETTIKEAMEVYWILKGCHIRMKYVIPYNIKNLYTFGYYESPVRIGVPRIDEAKAREAIRDYRAEKRRMNQNMAQSRGLRNGGVEGLEPIHEMKNGIYSPKSISTALTITGTSREQR